MLGLQWIQLSIECDRFWGVCLFLNFIKNTVNLIIYILNLKTIDYVQFIPVKQVKQDVKDSTFSQNLPMHKLPNVPEAFKEKYFPEKEMENLLELKDITNNL